MAKNMVDRIGAARGIAPDLKSKSRRRRQTLKAMAQVAVAPNPLRNDLSPKLDLVERAPKDLIVPARNIRKIEAAHLREVAASISALGYCAPVIIDGKGGVIDGAVRVEAAKLIGLPAISCVVVDHLGSAGLRVLRIALNRLQEKGVWDLGELKVEVGELILEGAPIEIAGFSLIEMDQICLDEEPEPAEAGPLQPEPGARAVARLGDVFGLGEHRILCGDATDPSGLRALMSGDKARLYAPL